MLNKKFLPTLIALLMTLIQPTLALSQTVRPDEKFLVRQLILNSSTWKVLKNKLIQNKNSDYLTQALYDWQLGLSSGYETNQNQSYTSSTLVTSDTNRYLTDLSLSKSFSTGTDLSFTLSNYSINFNSLGTKTNYNALGLQLKQSLWSNFFGEARRDQLKAAEQSIQQQDLSLIEQGESELMTALALYYKTFASQQSLAESEQIFKRYEDLASKIRKKQQYGNATPGEASQIQAELEAQRQNLNLQKQDLNANIADLKALLNIENLPTPLQAQTTPEKMNPPTPKASINDYRTLKIQALKKSSSELSYNQTLSENRPQLDLVLQHNSTSADDSQSNSFNNVVKGLYPKNYIGLQLTYTFGNDTRDKKVLQKKLDSQNENLLEENVRLQFIADQQKIHDKVQTLKANFLNLKNQLKFRQQAADELQRSYNQGRTDISVLIQALNKASQNQIELYQAQSNLIAASYSELELHDQLLGEFNLDPATGIE